MGNDASKGTQSAIPEGAAAAPAPATAQATSPSTSGPLVTTVFDVGMTCEGCAGAVKRILGKIDGVQETITDVGAKKVTVKGTADPQVMLSALKKWGDAAGKKVELAA